MMRRNILMKVFSIIAICASLFFTACAQEQVKNFVSLLPGQKALLEKTTQALDYGYGYDMNFELGYIYNHSFSKLNREQKEKAFSEIVMKADNGQYISFYLIIYQIKAEMRFRMQKFREDKSWKNYTYLKKYLLPPTEQYLDILEKYLLLKVPGITEKLPGLKKEIEDDIINYYKKLEYENEIRESST